MRLRQRIRQHGRARRINRAVALAQKRLLSLESMGKEALRKKGFLGKFSPQICVFASAFEKHSLGPAKSRIDLRLPQPLVEGEIPLGIYDKEWKLLGWFGLAGHKKEPVIAIESVQGNYRMKTAQGEFRASSKNFWQNELMETMIRTCRRLGFRKLLLVDPARQKHVANSKDPEKSIKMYYSLKGKFKFKRLPGIPDYYALNLR